MRSLGNGRRISVKKMKRKEEKDKNWKLLSLYTAFVAGVASYLSLWCILFDLLIDNKIYTAIIAMIFAIIVMVLFYCSKYFKFIDKIKNKKSLANILELYSIVGIIGFIVEKILRLIVEINNYYNRLFEWGDVKYFVFIIIIFLILPIVYMIVSINSPDWKMKVD